MAAKDQVAVAAAAKEQEKGLAEATSTMDKVAEVVGSLVAEAVVNRNNNNNNIIEAVAVVDEETSIKHGLLSNGQIGATSTGSS